MHTNGATLRPSKPLFAALERFLVDGTDETKGAVRFAFVETLQIAASRRLYGAGAFVPYLKPESKKAWLLADRALNVVECTKERLVVREEPHYVVGSTFTAIGVALAFVLPHVGGALFIPFAVFPGYFGLRSLVQSTVSFDRKSNILQIRRRLGRLRVEKRYKLADARRVTERETKLGKRLRLELTNGRAKNLTLWMDYSSFTSQVAMINEYTCESRKHLTPHGMVQGH
jgi:hypothetical protein